MNVAFTQIPSKNSIQITKSGLEIMSPRLRIALQIIILCSGWVLFTLTWETSPSENEEKRDKGIPTIKPTVKMISTEQPSQQQVAKIKESGWDQLIHLTGGLNTEIPNNIETPDGTIYGRLEPNNSKDRSWSLPFISGDGLRKVSDCLCDETSCLAKQIKCSIIFVKTDKIKQFIETVYPNIMTSFVLITHNSDYTSPWSDNNVRGKHGLGSLKDYEFQVKKLLEDPQILKWYGQNPSVVHEKLVPLPIGLENKYNAYGRHVSVYRGIHDAVRKSGVEKSMLLFANFNPRTNPVVRGEAAKHLSQLGSDNELITVEIQSPKKKKKNSDKLAALSSYAEKASQHKFCLAPPGHGLDTHRLWESFAFSCIPIVLSSTMDSIFEDLPILIVKSWSEITIERLNSEYDSFSQRKDFHLSKLYLPYWIDRMRKDVAAG